jgi:large repetitive protein
MKKLLLFIGVFCTIYSSNAQAITVNTTQFTVPQLVENILFGSQSTSGTGVISNITWSTGTNFGSTNGIGYFSNTNPSLPIDSGLLLVTGNVTTSAGPNGTTQSNGNWPGDTQLFDYVTGLGIDTNLFDYNDATIIEFDFIPLINNLSFDFVFASEEYGVFQCAFSDAFAFFLNDITAGTPVENIALVPNTSTPISVITIRDNLFNEGCPSVNPEYFDNLYLSYPGGIDPNQAPTNFNGQTVVLTAESDVTPNHTYHIKLVIADRNDSALDSGVLISAGSFYLGQELRGMYGSGFENFKDFTIQNGGALCSQETRRINLGVMPITGATYEWYKNNVLIANANTYFYDVTEAGNYSVKMKFANNAEISDAFIVEYYPAMNIENPTDLFSETLIYDLTQNSTTILNGQDPANYEIAYFTSLADAQNQSNPIANLNSYNGFNGQEIFVSVEEMNGSGCIETKTFTLYQSLSNDSFTTFNVVHHPNPINDILNLSSDKSISSVKIINLLGQELYTEYINKNEVQIDLSHFPSGTYLVKVISEDASKTFKVVKN